MTRYQRAAAGMDAPHPRHPPVPGGGVHRSRSRRHQADPGDRLRAGIPQHRRGCRDGQGEGAVLSSACRHTGVPVRRERRPCLGRLDAPGRRSPLQVARAVRRSSPYESTRSASTPSSSAGYRGRATLGLSTYGEYPFGAIAVHARRARRPFPGYRGGYTSPRGSTSTL